MGCHLCGGHEVAVSLSEVSAATRTTWYGCECGSGNPAAIRVQEGFVHLVQPYQPCGATWSTEGTPSTEFVPVFEETIVHCLHCWQSSDRSSLATTTTIHQGPVEVSVLAWKAHCCRCGASSSTVDLGLPSPAAEATKDFLEATVEVARRCA